MPVIINDLEIVSDSEAQRNPPAEADATTPKPNILPQQLDAVLKRMQTKSIRVRAD